MEYVTLSNGIKMPILGYGVYHVTKDECERCVLDALKAGYRSLDTAQSYFNEEEVGAAIEKSGVPREDIFLTTKVWVEHYGYDACKRSVEEFLKKLKTDYIDLMLLHQPFSDYYGAWRALEDLYEEGVLRAIGVSNFYPDRLVDIASFARIAPMVNQVETHPHNQQTKAKKWMDKYQIQHEAWAPFGEGRNGLFEDPVTAEMERAFGVRPVKALLGLDLICVFASEEQVRNMTPDQQLLTALEGRIQNATARGWETDCVSRSFCPKLSISEDPVCGSAHCQIADYWSRALGKSEIFAYQASKRGGYLRCRPQGNGRITISGEAALVAISEIMAKL